MKTINITIAPDGNTVVETAGFSGSQCRQASRFIEASLGKTTSEQLTSEFHTVQPQHHARLDQEK